jgi:acyl dehydratase
MAAATSLTFSSPPSVWGSYPKVLFARKAKHVRDGESVPRIEAHLTRVRIDPGHLGHYRAVCGAPAGEGLPPAYPHVLAMPLHIAMLTTDTFPVQLLGLVHVGNRIEQQRPVRPEDVGEMRAVIEGHREVDRGQEFDMHTELQAKDGMPIWREVCTFLARRRRKKGDGKGTAQPSRNDDDAQPQSVRSSSFRADASIGRRYGWVSGDVNPIHLADLSARAFGFERAIAHGMWSLARCAAELGPAAFSKPCVFDVQFKLPIFLPAWVMLQSWQLPSGGTGFALRDAQGEKPHLTGSLAVGN